MADLKELSSDDQRESAEVYALRKVQRYLSVL